MMSDTPTDESARERADREYFALVETQKKWQTAYDEVVPALETANKALADARKVRRALMSNAEKRDEDQAAGVTPKTRSRKTTEG